MREPSLSTGAFVGHECLIDATGCFTRRLADEELLRKMLSTISDSTRSVPACGISFPARRA
jgi:hypothetical protein